MMYNNVGIKGSLTDAGKATAPSHGGEKLRGREGRPRICVMEKRILHVNIFYFGPPELGGYTIVVFCMDVKKKMEGGELPVKDLKIILDILKLFVQPKEGKEENADSVGPAAMRFRRSLLKNVFHNARLNTFRVFGDLKVRHL